MTRSNVIAACSSAATGLPALLGKGGMRTGLAVMAAVATLMISGCATTTGPQAAVTELPRAGANPKVVLMPPDVELSEVTLGGVAAPRAEWTATAAEQLLQGISSQQVRRGYELVRLQPADFEAGAAQKLDQIRKVHALLSKAIVLERKATLRPPNRKSAFDWTLGPGLGPGGALADPLVNAAAPRPG